MKVLKLPDLTPEAIKSLDRLYRTARDPRLRMRAHMVLLAAEKALRPDEIAEIVRSDTQTVRRWLKRYSERGLSGLYDASRPGGPPKVTEAYLARLIEVARQPPGAAGLPHARWSAQRLAEYMAAHTDVTVHPETIRLHLKAAGIHLEKPQTKAPGKASRTPVKSLTSK